MQPRTSLLCTVVLMLSTTVFFWGVAMAADQPKEGTYSGTFSGWGTFKGIRSGKKSS